MKKDNIRLFKNVLTLKEKQDQEEKDLVYIVELLLQSFRQWKRMEFKPNKRAMRSLVEMGFEDKNVIGALKVTGNDQANAVSCNGCTKDVYLNYIFILYLSSFISFVTV